MGAGRRKRARDSRVHEFIARSVFGRYITIISDKASPKKNIIALVNNEPFINIF